MNEGLPRLHAITDERIARRRDLDVTATAIAAGAPGRVAVHARGRTLSGREHFTLAQRLGAAAGAVLFVNDRLDIAVATGARGVQLGNAGLATADARRIGRDWWIGRSVHSLAEGRAATDEHPDYLLVGPVFATPTHPEAIPLGLEGLAPIVALGLPVIAIGGITVDRAGALRAAGVYGVAAIRALWDARDPAAVTRSFLQVLETR